MADAKLLMLITAKLHTIFSCTLIWMALLPFHINNLFKQPKTSISFFQKKNSGFQQFGFVLLYKGT